MAEQNDLSEYKEALGASYNHAGNYANAIVGGGYAGFFAIWALTKDRIPSRAMAWAGILIVVSILFFIAFEIIKMVYAKVDLDKQAAALSRPDQYLELLAAHKSVQARITLHLQVHWTICFSVSILTGLAAAGIVLSVFIKQLLGCA